MSTCVGAIATNRKSVTEGTLGTIVAMFEKLAPPEFSAATR